MMHVDIRKCNGCGLCLEVCPVEAILLKAGKAVIDMDTCLVCGSCSQACPEGAVSDIRLPVPVKPMAIQPVETNATRTVLRSRSAAQVSWAKPVLSFLWYEIVPRVADQLVAALDRRISASARVQTTSNSRRGLASCGRRHQIRQRCRGKKLGQSWIG